MRTLSGVQPSGRLHLGNYYGALQQFIELQHHSESLYFIANLHALTTLRDAAELRNSTLEAALAFLSFGLDPSKSILFRQSDIPEITELYWILGSLVPLPNLERAHSYKDKTARGIAANLGLFAYPVLMASDILVFGADVVPVGKDQIQHIEFARDWATRFNMAFVAGYDPQDPEAQQAGHVRGILKLPEARVEARTAVVPGTDGQKMSKSIGNAIELFAEDREVKRQIMSIRTDSTPIELPKPTDGPLYQLLELLLPAAAFAQVDASWRSGGKGYGDYKKVLLEHFHARFDKPRLQRAELLKDPGEVERILLAGASRAREIASRLMAQVRHAVGIV